MKKKLYTLGTILFITFAFTGCSTNTVDVELTTAGDAPIKVISILQDELDIEMMDAKEYVDSAPQIIAEDMSKEEADSLKSALEEAGATVTLK